MSVSLDKHTQPSNAIVVYKPKDSLAVLTERAYAACKRSLEALYLDTYKASLGGEETPEYKMIRSAYSEEETVSRLHNYYKIAPYLSHLTDKDLLQLLASSKSLKSNAGGEVLTLEVEGVLLFIKKIRLSAIEQQHPKSTQNLFGLPTYYQYGVRSMGFGAWRESAAHEMTTRWVLEGKCQNFPLMYHSRVLPRSTPIEPLTQERLKEIQGEVDSWNSLSAVGVRVKAVDTAEADIVVFLEHLPHTLDGWLSVEHGKGNLTEQIITKLERELLQVTAFMKSRGFLHFDAHFHNVLASDNHVYFADLGLAMSREFDLSQEERTFFEKHSDYDRFYVVTKLVRNAIAVSLGIEEYEVKLNTVFSNGKVIIELPSAVATLVQRYGPIAHLMDKFLQDLREENSKSTPYPKAELEQEWAKLQK